VSLTVQEVTDGFETADLNEFLFGSERLWPSYAPSCSRSTRGRIAMEGGNDPPFARVLSGASVTAAILLGDAAQTRGRNETESGR
jgi:hypothetical protein